jgi:hypothetical protein
MTVSDIDNAYAGRLGHVDPVYADPNLGTAATAEHEEHVHVQPPEVVEAPPAVEEPADEDDLEGFTVAELKEELDALGVEYDPKARKADLIELVRQAEDAS